MSGGKSAHNIYLKISIVQQLLSPNANLTWLSLATKSDPDQPPATRPPKEAYSWHILAPKSNWILLVQCWVSLKTEMPPPSWLAIGTKIRF